LAKVPCSGWGEDRLGSERRTLEEVLGGGTRANAAGALSEMWRLEPSTQLWHQVALPFDKAITGISGRPAMAWIPQSVAIETPLSGGYRCLGRNRRRHAIQLDNPAAWNRDRMTLQLVRQRRRFLGRFSQQILSLGLQTPPRSPVSL
jgi:hypothetical protein